MIKRNPENERIKRRYLLYLRDAKGRDQASVDAAASAIERFEDYVKRRDFRSFHIEQARGFKAQLVTATNGRTGIPDLGPSGSESPRTFPRQTARL
jgi:hypothetical protein